MNRDLYDLTALAMRYVFAGLMALIVFRAWRITVTDNRRARQLRQLAPETGLSGELVVLNGAEGVEEGARYPVIREGIIGSSRSADVRIRHSSVRRQHAYFRLTQEGLELRSHGAAQISKSWEEPVQELLVKDGDSVEIGAIQLLLVLSGAEGASAVSPETPTNRPKNVGDDLFDIRGQAVSENKPKSKPIKKTRRRAEDDDLWI